MIHANTANLILKQNDSELEQSRQEQKWLLLCSGHFSFMLTKTSLFSHESHTWIIDVIAFQSKAMRTFPPYAVLSLCTFMWSLLIFCYFSLQMHFFLCFAFILFCFWEDWLNVVNLDLISLFFSLPSCNLISD